MDIGFPGRTPEVAIGGLMGRQSRSAASTLGRPDWVGARLATEQTEVACSGHTFHMRPVCTGPAPFPGFDYKRDP